MPYVKLTLAVDNRYQEMLIAELMELEFDEFQQLEDAIIACIPVKRFHLSDRERIERLLHRYPGNGYIKSEERLEDQNWNARWEQTVKAQEIGPFLVKPTWSNRRANEGQTLLEIDPKMAFGTGYHATTRLMLCNLPEIIHEGDEVLDAGTGSGILAIAAAKLRAASVFAFDIDDWSFTNARENIFINKVDDCITLKKGTQEVVSHNQYVDVILANIQRNVLIEMMPFFANHLRKGGRLLLSGLLTKDEDEIHKSMEENKLKVMHIYNENEWIAVQGRQ